MDHIIQNVVEQFLTTLAKFPAYAPFILILGIVAVILYKAHTGEDKFSFFDLIKDKDTGKGSLEKVGMLTAMLSVTWWFVDLAARGVAKYEDAIAYAGLLGLAKFANNWLSAKYGSAPPKE